MKNKKAFVLSDSSLPLLWLPRVVVLGSTQTVAPPFLKDLGKQGLEWRRMGYRR